MPAGQQVEVDDHEQIVERVAAIDVAKASGMVCIRVPHPAKPGRRATKVWQVPATTNAIIELAEQLAGQGIQRVVVESTSDYWRPFVYLLEARGLMVWLVNARDVKHLPGRPKTDTLDAVWLAKPQRAGHAATLVRPSGRDPPVAGLHPAAVRPDRRPRPAGAAAGAGCRVDALIKLGTVATDIMGVSGRAMLEALVAGQRDPKVLAELARGRMRGKRGALVQALTGRFDDHHAELARMLGDHSDALTAQLDRLTARIQELSAAIPAAQVPGDGDRAAGGSDDGTTGASANQRAAQPPLGALERLDVVELAKSKGFEPWGVVPDVIGFRIALDHPQVIEELEWRGVVRPIVEALQEVASGTHGGKGSPYSNVSISARTCTGPSRGPRQACRAGTPKD